MNPFTKIKRTILVFAIQVLSIILPRVAVADNFWAISGVGGQTLYTVNPTAGSATLMWTLPGSYNYRALAFGNGYLWGISGVGGQTVYRVNPANGSATLMWTLPGSYNYTALAFGNGYLWGISGVGGQTVYRVDPASGSASLMWTLPGSYNYRALAFGNGYLWGISGVGGQTVYRVNPANGSTTLMWTLPGSYNYITLTFEDGYLWGISGVGGQTVYRVDPSNGSATLMSTLPGSYSYRALAFQDATPPTVTINSELSSYSATSSPSFSFTASDSGSGLASVQYQVDGGALTTATSPVALSGLTDGSHTFALQATDNAGNVGGASYTWTVDTTPPSVTISAPSVTSTNGGSVSYTVTFADANFSSASMPAFSVGTNKAGSASVTNIDVTPATGTATSTNYIVTLSGVAGNGTLGITVPAGAAIDKAGNSSAATASGTFMVYTTPPTLFGVQLSGNGAIRFSFTNNPNNSFIVLSTTNLSLPLTNWTLAGTPTNAGSAMFQFTSTPTTNNPQRFYIIRSP